MCLLSREQSIISRETLQNVFFFSELCSFLTWTFCRLSSTQQPSVGTGMRCSCLLSSSAGFGENLRYCSTLGVVFVVQKLTFCNISVVIEDTYFTLGICVHSPKSNQSFKGDDSKCIISELCPFFHLEKLNTFCNICYF